MQARVQDVAAFGQDDVGLSPIHECSGMWMDDMCSKELFVINVLKLSPSYFAVVAHCRLSVSHAYNTPFFVLINILDRLITDEEV